MSFRGHKNWNHWNVALWLFNDRDIYQMMVTHVESNQGYRDLAAQNILAGLPSHTPDGAPYTPSSVRAALVGWES